MVSSCLPNVKIEKIIFVGLSDEFVCKLCTEINCQFLFFGVMFYNSYSKTWHKKKENLFILVGEIARISTNQPTTSCGLISILS